MSLPRLPYAIIIGIGPGTGASIAHLFSKSYPVALLSRSPSNHSPLVNQINASGGTAIGISTDTSDATSLTKAFAQIKKELGEQCAVAVFNASGPFQRKGLLELTEEEFSGSWEVGCKGAFLFSQQAMPLLLNHASSTSTSSTLTSTKPSYPPTLIFTGATASIKSSALLSSFSTQKHALRALSLSIAREFAPKGVHVAHAVIDGIIDIPRTKEWAKDWPIEGKIDPDAIAEAYWNLHTQSNRAFTNEIDIRPMLEKW